MTPVCVSIEIESYLYTDNGHRIIYEREVPFELRIIEPEILRMVGTEVGSREVVRVKIMLRVCHFK